MKNRSSHGFQIRNYFNINEKSSIGETTEDYIEYERSVNVKWGPTFEMICVSIIYHVRIISIANISCGFMVSDTLSLVNAYNIGYENSGMSDMYIYVYFHLYRHPFTPCTHRIVLNHFAYFEFSEELPTNYIRQIYYCDRRDNARSRKIGHPISAPSLSDDVFSLIVSSF